MINTFPRRKMQVDKSISLKSIKTEPKGEDYAAVDEKYKFYLDIKKQNFEILKYLVWMIALAFTVNTLSINTGKVAGVIPANTKMLIPLAQTNILILAICVIVLTWGIFKLSQYNLLIVSKGKVEDNAQYSFAEELSNVTEINKKSIGISHLVINISCVMFFTTLLLNIIPICLINAFK